jgi:hypothetical protein
MVADTFASIEIGPGMIVDGAHPGHRTQVDMLEVSEVPVVYTHLGIHSLHHQIRNLQHDGLLSGAAPPKGAWLASRARVVNWVVAEEKGADNPILLNLEGNVTEGPGFNVFCVTDGLVGTPNRDVPEGISRLSASDHCREMGLPCDLRKVPVAELSEADEIFVTSTAGGIIPATRLDSRIFGNRSPGTGLRAPARSLLAEAARWLACRAGRLCERKGLADQILTPAITSPEEDRR